jgi:hypothetical protein
MTRVLSMAGELKEARTTAGVHSAEVTVLLCLGQSRAFGGGR